MNHQLCVWLQGNPFVNVPEGSTQRARAPEVCLHRATRAAPPAATARGSRRTSTTSPQLLAATSTTSPKLLATHSESAGQSRDTTHLLYAAAYSIPSRRRDVRCWGRTHYINCRLVQWFYCFHLIFFIAARCACNVVTCVRLCVFLNQCKCYAEWLIRNMFDVLYRIAELIRNGK